MLEQTYRAFLANQKAEVSEHTSLDISSYSTPIALMPHLPHPHSVRSIHYARNDIRVVLYLAYEHPASRRLSEEHVLPGSRRIVGLGYGHDVEFYFLVSQALATTFHEVSQERIPLDLGNGFGGFKNACCVKELLLEMRRGLDDVEPGLVDALEE